MMKLADSQQRQLALDPSQSFIVQAPAGSGKTTLLIQRYLKLLGSVNKPEEILAITFTRKAANEMRDRILRALQQASKISSASTDLTLTLAQQALTRSKLNNWDLINNPKRLAIKTIDSLCAQLSKLLPILTRFGAQPAINDQPTQLYQKTIAALLEDLATHTNWQPALTHLLLHLDNNFTKIYELLTSLLAKRDHWLPLLMQYKQHSKLRTHLENNLTLLNNDIIATVVAELEQAQLTTALLQCLQFASCYAPTEGRLALWKEQSHFPTPHASNKELWLAIPDLLLTSQNQWREKLNKNQGFPAPGSTANPIEKALFKNNKQLAEKLLQQATNYDELLTALIELKLSPPTSYTATQWQILADLMTILPILCAKLRLTFITQASIDFNEMLLASLTALGEPEEPTDLALRLDYQIQHILVDEFQDTSISQLKLLEKLTYGWELNDGRSLFLVGDPMQSIYRFRHAEVSLFLRCRSKGLNGLPLVPLTLSVNFRSQQSLVDWFNASFSRLFPTLENLNFGAVTYSPSTAIQLNNDASINYYLTNTDRLTEAQRVITIINENKNVKLAILVQTRNHLEYILPALQQANISYQGIDLDPLTECIVIQDLLTLTRAIIHLGDRIAWLALLRAPWCGLVLDDLLLLSQTEPDETIWQRLNNPFVVAMLSTEGAQRIDKIVPLLTVALASRFRKPFANLVKDTWKALGGAELLTTSQKFNDCETYFDCLQQHSKGGTVEDLSLFISTLENLYVKPANNTDCPVFIMTIHKAKGLEFDAVILPGLDRSLPRVESQLLLWQELTNQQAEKEDANLLLAPIKASDQDSDPIYAYLNNREKRCAAQENRRLFYVAVTRAKAKLYLLACQTSRSASKESFLNYLLHAYPELITTTVRSTTIDEAPVLHSPLFQRLPLQSISPNTNRLTIIPGHNQLNQQKLIWYPADEKIVGTLTHRILQQIILDGLNQWSIEKVVRMQAHWLTQLKQAGIHTNHLDNALETITQAIKNTLTHSDGQWLLNPHPVSHTEFALTAKLNNKIQQFYIDRVFIDQQGQLWFVDFKTTRAIDVNNPVVLEELLLIEKQRYQYQLKIYQQILEQHFSQPARYGLYFTTLPLWLEYTDAA